MFDVLHQLPADPILGLSAAYKADSNPNKIDLGVGVYKDENGKTPILQAVQQAQAILQGKEESKTYIAPQGVQGFIDGMLNLLLGEANPVLLADRVAAVQAPGGCGSLRILAELVKRCNPDTVVWVSDPTWANHIPLIGDAGLEIKTYPYFDKQSASIKFDAMADCLKNQVNPGDIVLLHGCCHNPTGADLTQQQWDVVADLAVEKGFVPFIDIAYQGFGDALEDDAYGLRLMASKVPEMMIAASCSKNFGLYRERVGLAAIVTTNASQRNIVQSQIQSVARGIYSMPPSYGGALVDIVLNDSRLKLLWETEVTEMRERMKQLRALLVDNLKAQGANKDFEFINQQKGMFTFLCISPEQVETLVNQHSVYLVGSSRINIAGISKQNVEPLAKAIASVL